MINNKLNHQKVPVIIGTELAKTSQRIKFEVWVLGQNICKKYGAKLTINANGIQSRKYRWVNFGEELRVLNEEFQTWDTTKDLMDIEDLNAIYIITNGN